MKYLLVLILILSQLNFANANSRGTLLKTFNFGERSIVAELDQYIYMLFDHEDKYLTYSLTTPGFNHVIDIPKLEMQKQLLEEKLFKSNVWQKKSFYYLNENYFFNRSIVALASYRLIKEDDNTVIEVNLICRGTRNAYDWFQNFETEINNLDNEKQLCQAKKIPGAVHNGFLKAYSGLSGEIALFIKSLRQGNSKGIFRINLSGHSLGAALASVCALHFSCLLETELTMDRNMIHLTTFGSPRVFNRDGADYLEKTLDEDNILRFVNIGKNLLPDLVTIIPYSLGYVSEYKHVGHDCYLYPTDPKFYIGSSQNSYLSTPHSMEGYLNEYFKEGQCANNLF